MVQTATRNKQRVARVCQCFIANLVGLSAMERVDLFEILENQSKKAGYQISAQQQGIRGTVLSFEPTPKLLASLASQMTGRMIPK